MNVFPLPKLRSPISPQTHVSVSYMRACNCARFFLAKIFVNYAVTGFDERVVVRIFDILDMMF